MTKLQTMNSVRVQLQYVLWLMPHSAWVTRARLSVSWGLDLMQPIDLTVQPTRRTNRSAHFLHDGIVGTKQLLRRARAGVWPKSATSSSVKQATLSRAVSKAPLQPVPSLFVSR